MTHNILPKKELFGLPYLQSSYEAAVSYLIQLSLSEGRHLICTPNTHGFFLFKRHPEMKNVYKQASGAFLDGMPLVWAACLLNGGSLERVSGADLFVDVFIKSIQLGGKIFILGGMPGVPEKAISNLGLAELIYKQISFYTPPFGFEKNTVESNKIAQIINGFKPNIVFAALGTPKQELWVCQHKDTLDFGVAIGVGASVDFAAGIQKRAPGWMREIGLEWLYRLSREPKRLWRRYLVTNLYFMVYIPRLLVKAMVRKLSKSLFRGKNVQSINC
ncbi:MAG: WecB/TagA/CpsF family glycosyltransferase [Chitinispirillaceae bacterium]|nr:WecB/TagA/CpsF family glycosyltransferase [Chitinispirillaceae bacterium]